MLYFIKKGQLGQCLWQVKIGFLWHTRNITSTKWTKKIQLGKKAIFHFTYLGDEVLTIFSSDLVLFSKGFYWWQNQYSVDQKYAKNFSLQQTLNLSTCADSSTNKNINKCPMSTVMRHLSNVTCLVLHVTCHISLTPTAL